MAETRQIHVCVLEGQLVELTDAGVPFSICLHMQQLGLSCIGACSVVNQTDIRWILHLFVLAQFTGQEHEGCSHLQDHGTF